MSEALDYTGLIWVTLIILKILGYLSWGWFAVLLFPIWMPILLAITVLVCVIVLAIIFLAIVFLLTLLGVGKD